MCWVQMKGSNKKLEQVEGWMWVQSSERKRYKEGGSMCNARKNGMPSRGKFLPTKQRQRERI